ncbi:hypothetical protein E9993_18320 [Labilibacter sediminis]|nr:hypothetical protein E9993_18320 [Labilibacter sediminis]
MILVVFVLFRMLLVEDPLRVSGKALMTGSTIYSEWVCVKNAKGVTLHERWVKVDESLKVRMRKGEFEVDCSFEEAIAFIENYRTIETWMKGIEQITPLTENDKMVYVMINLPWPFSNRDFVARSSSVNVDDNKHVVRFKSENYHVKHKKGCVRIKDYSASWTIERISNHKSKITFTVFSSEPPLFPEWIQEPVIKNVFLNNLHRLKKHLSTRIM